MRALCVLALVSIIIPGVASAQSFTPSFSIQGGAGPTLVDTGSHLSAGVGFSPLSRVTLFLDVQRTHLSSRVTRTPTSVSRFRGGTMTAVSGEARVSLFPPHRVTPFVVAGYGIGVSHPNVNHDFPDPVTNDTRFLILGGGIHVPVRDRLSLVGDVRLQAGVEGGTSLLAMLPVRVGVAWRF